jgi:hypothetical protein
VAGVKGSHSDLPPELRALAQALLDRLDPAVRTAAALAAGRGGGRCQQVWCPVCALAALVRGEQHPLLTVIADHSVALLALVRAMVDDLDDGRPAPSSYDRPPDTPPGGPANPPDPPVDEPPPSGPGRYQHIPVSFDE